jgi:DNA-directed RNA polymerase subunit RPC12/RpoP
MTIYIYVYMCVNLACRAIERRSGVKKSMIECPYCGSKMRHIKTEKEK